MRGIGRTTATLAVALVVLSGCSSVGSVADPGTTPPSASAIGPRPASPAVVTILEPKNGDTVPADGATLRVSLTGATLTDVTSQDIAPDEGHLHVSIDGELISMTAGLTQAHPRPRSGPPHGARRVRRRRSSAVRSPRGDPGLLRGAMTAVRTAAGAETRQEGTAWPRIVAAGLVLAAAAAIALRPATLASADLSQTQRTWLLASLYAAIAVASLLPAMPRDHAVLPASTTALAGIAAVGLAWATAGPTAPLAVAPASLALSMAAAVAEEALFRRLAYGHLRRFGVAGGDRRGRRCCSRWCTSRRTETAALPVDLGAGLLFGWQRWASGTWTVPAATHAAANLLAVIR